MLDSRWSLPRAATRGGNDKEPTEGRLMPFCPKCRDEFREEIPTCPDCKVALIKQLPPLPPLPKRPERETEPLVLIATAPNEVIAEIWVDILKQNGIRALIKRSPRLAWNYGVSAFDDVCEIHVLASQAKEAKEILEPPINAE